MTDTSDYWHLGWNIGFAYACGFRDAQETTDISTYRQPMEFGNFFAEHYASTRGMTQKGYVQVWDAYKSWIIQGTMGKDEQKIPPLEKCEAAE